MTSTMNYNHTSAATINDTSTFSTSYEETTTSWVADFQEAGLYCGVGIKRLGDITNVVLLTVNPMVFIIGGIANVLNIIVMR